MSPRQSTSEHVQPSQIFVVTLFAKSRVVLAFPPSSRLGHKGKHFASCTVVINQAGLLY